MRNIAPKGGERQIEFGCQTLEEGSVVFLDLTDGAGSRDSVIDDGPCLLWKSICFDATVDEVDGLRGSDKTLVTGIGEEEFFETAKSSLGVGRSLDGFLELLGNRSAVFRIALEGFVEGRVFGLDMQMRLGYKG